MKRKKLRSLKSLRAELDRTFSEYVRRRAADKNDMAVCVSCGTTAFWKQLQAGHYVSRRHLATRWHPMNAWVQCATCNVLKRGNMAAYSAWMIENKGADLPRILVDLSKQNTSYKRSDLEALLEHYQKAIANLPN